MQLKSMNVVAIGGGHGLGRVLSTLSFLEDKLTGIVATTDNGGSTGKLRRRSSGIAWGDLRNCLTELTNASSLPTQLFNFRFDGKDELAGHNLGNLILYAMSDIDIRPMDAIRMVSQLLGVKTAVHPMSEKATDLLAFYKEGRVKVGELSVDDMTSMPEHMMLAPLVKAQTATIAAIKAADVIIIGPGSFLTSVVPPLLVHNITKAINNSNAKVLFIDNIVNEQSPAGKLSLDDKLNWLTNNIGCQMIDAIITNNSDASSSLVPVVQHPLANDTVHYFHDKVRLIEAIERAIAMLEQQPVKKRNPYLPPQKVAIG